MNLVIGNKKLLNNWLDLNKNFISKWNKSEKLLIFKNGEEFMLVNPPNFEMIRGLNFKSCILLENINNEDFLTYISPALIK